MLFTTVPCFFHDGLGWNLPTVTDIKQRDSGITHIGKLGDSCAYNTRNRCLYATVFSRWSWLPLVLQWHCKHNDTHTLNLTDPAASIKKRPIHYIHLAAGNVQTVHHRPQMPTRSSSTIPVRTVYTSLHQRWTSFSAFSNIWWSARAKDVNVNIQTSQFRRLRT